MSLAQQEGNQVVVIHKADAFQADTVSPEWNIAGPELQFRQTLTHYHFNWHGDSSLRIDEDLHGDLD